MHLGDTWVGQVSAGTEPIDVCYNQAVTQRLSVGGQGQFSAAQQAVGLLYGFKYNTPRYSLGFGLREGCVLTSFEYNSGGYGASCRLSVWLFILFFLVPSCLPFSFFRLRFSFFLLSSLVRVSPWQRVWCAGFLMFCLCVHCGWRCVAAPTCYINMQCVSFSCGLLPQSSSL